MNRDKILQELRGYKNFWKFDFEHYNMWCSKLGIKASDTKNIEEFKKFVEESE